MESKVKASRSKRITWAARGVSAVAGTIIAGALIATPAVAQSSTAGKPVPKKQATSAAAVAAAKAPMKGLGGHGPRSHQKIVRAVVESDGDLVRGQSFGAASATRIIAGTYQVCFDVRVTNGTYVASIGLPGNSFSSLPGEITVVGRADTNNCLFIQTFNSAGVLADRGFHVAVAYTAKRHH